MHQTSRFNKHAGLWLSLMMTLLTGISACQSGAPVQKSSPPTEKKTVIKKPEPEPAPVPRVRSAKTKKDQDKFYSDEQPTIKVLQKANEALKGFEVDRKGEVDWVKALHSGKINPRADLHGKTKMKVMDLDIIMTNTLQMPHVLFPHRAHTEWLDCSNCHDEIFKPKAGANKMNMTDIYQGRYCGVCHEKVAFSSFICERCHSLPHADSPESWW